MIGISGIARSGKDTLALCLKKIIEQEFECEVEIVSLADQIKSDLDKLIACNFHFPVRTDNTDDKNLIRPILVAYGEAMKEKWGERVWLDKLEEKLSNRKDKKFYIIADVRFEFEAKHISEKNGWVIHIEKIGNEAPNETEKENDPKVAAVSDQCHSWPPLADNMSECDDHAEILWQMTPHYIKEQWKQNLN